MHKRSTKNIILIWNLKPSGTTLCATSYGNGMASRGSAISPFIEQIIAGLSKRWRWGI